MTLPVEYQNLISRRALEAVAPTPGVPRRVANYYQQMLSFDRSCLTPSNLHRGGRWLCRGALGLACVLALHGCAFDPNASGRTVIKTTYEKHLARAIGGNADSQNLLGFMHYFGDGVERDNEAALIWFNRAAAQGHADAVTSLARLTDEVVRESEIPTPRDTPGGTTAAAQPGDARPKRVLEPGEETYAAFCAGCHGLNGIAAYVDSPSFALGDRLDNIDLILRRSIIEGIGTMPGWGEMIPRAELDDLVNFMRSLSVQYRRGIDQTLRDSPTRYFLFSVMQNNNRAFKRDQSAPASAPYVRKSSNSQGEN